ncbi:MAG: hypothetical protein MSA90_21965 [Faecalicatena sp.]|uniref:hypothetical protein n=1 Tax=Faecalicatena sp. TaxID=2005360 RepID=UPI002588694F|nr:hypothetical protein [Faecalicatena sp.]MCI6468117.1 hypothetical protein [Faecalicatena sp.]MDY4670914.1 hypothetical protein [Oliverpabstia sp.]MDY5620370.1 hypothetical protein [Lachnospiraceae bacterium]
MKLLIFNDSQSLEVQAVYREGNAIHVRVIHVTPDELKGYFKDEFLTRNMVLKENNKEIEIYENYTVFSYIKEDAGGIYEVEMVQEGKDIKTRIDEAEMAAQDAQRTANESVTAMQEAIAELTMLIATTMTGGEANV